MPKEVLEITPSGGIYCLVDLKKSVTIPAVFNCAKPNGYLIQDILQENRIGEEQAAGFYTDGDILRWAFSTLCQAPMGRALAYDARFDGWMISIDGGDETGPGAESEDKCLYITRYADSVAAFSRDTNAQMKFLFQLAKGLRLIWQENILKVDTQRFEPGEYIKFERLTEADSDICALLAAYQLREKSEHGLWRYALSSDLHALAVTLADCLDFDVSADNILDTLGFVFQDWFMDDARLNRIDHVSLTRLDIMSDYEFGHEDVGLDMLIRLSTLPDGFSYLEYSAAEILGDSFYARMAHDINEAHLKQICRESQIHLIEEIGFRDVGLARKFFPNSTFETVV